MAYPVAHPMAYRWSILLKLGSALPQTCVNNVLRQSVICTTLFRPLGGVSLKISGVDKSGVVHGLPYGPPYGLPVVNFLKLVSALLLTCINNMPHESVIPTTLFCPFGGVSLKFSTQTRGRLESEKPECHMKH